MTSTKFLVTLVVCAAQLFYLLPEYLYSASVQLVHIKYSARSRCCVR